MALDPNGYEANLFMGFYLQFAGEPAPAIEHLLTARRLNPVLSFRDVAFLGLAYFMNHDYAGTVRAYTEGAGKFSRASSNPTLAAAYALLDQPDEASAVVRRLKKSRPGFNLSEWKFLNSYKLEENRRRLYEAAKKAVIPEFPKNTS